MPELNGDEAGTMIERGSVRLGKPGELFTFVRFFDKVGYVATFEQRDPFYVVDLSDIDNPVALGELDVDGFSSFLFIPVDAFNDIFPADSFSGFIVFVVNEDGIEEDCRIEETVPETSVDVCFYNAFLPARSLLFDGNIEPIWILATHSEVSKSQSSLTTRIASIEQKQTQR